MKQGAYVKSVCIRNAQGQIMTNIPGSRIGYPTVECHSSEAQFVGHAATAGSFRNAIPDNGSVTLTMSDNHNITARFEAQKDGHRKINVLSKT